MTVVAIISRIPDIVREKQMSLAELSRRTELTYRTVVKLYYADFTSIHIDVLDRLCAALGATPGDLLAYAPGSAGGRPKVNRNAFKQTHPLNKRAKTGSKRSRNGADGA